MLTACEKSNSWLHTPTGEKKVYVHVIFTARTQTQLRVPAKFWILSASFASNENQVRFLVEIKAGRFVLGIVLYLQYLYVLGLPNTYYGYCYFPNTIQYNNFFEENSGPVWKVKHTDEK